MVKFYKIYFSGQGEIPYWW